MSVAIVIPARMHSTRLPNKPLIDILGKSMIHRVYERAKAAQLAQEVIVATDHIDIYTHCEENGIRVEMTSESHVTGTDRIVELLPLINATYIVNVQGDEPLIDPRQIDQLIKETMTVKAKISTQCIAIKDIDTLFDYNVVKVVNNKHNKALYFSRQAIPAHRDLPYDKWLSPTVSYWRHVGMYMFHRDFLSNLYTLLPSILEESEKLEQLRFLENGYDVYCFPTQYASHGVDTQGDLDTVRDLIFRQQN